MCVNIKARLTQHTPKKSGLEHAYLISLSSTAEGIPDNETLKDVRALAGAPLGRPMVRHEWHLWSVVDRLN